MHKWLDAELDQKILDDIYLSGLPHVPIGYTVEENNQVWKKR